MTTTAPPDYLIVPDAVGRSVGAHQEVEHIGPLVPLRIAYSNTVREAGDE